MKCVESVSVCRILIATASGAAEPPIYLLLLVYVRTTYPRHHCTQTPVQSTLVLPFLFNPYSDSTPLKNDSKKSNSNPYE